MSFCPKKNKWSRVVRFEAATNMVSDRVNLKMFDNRTIDGPSRFGAESNRRPLKCSGALSTLYQLSYRTILHMLRIVSFVFLLKPFWFFRQH